MVACPLKDLGCSVQVMRGELDSHISGANHTSLLLAAVLDLKKQATKAETELAQAKVETAAAKVEAEEAKEVAEKACREAERAKAQVKIADGLDTMAFTFTSDGASTSTDFFCGGVKFHLVMGEGSLVGLIDKALCVWLYFDLECDVRLKLEVSSYVKVTGGMGVHDILLESFEPSLRLQSTEEAGFCKGFVVRDVDDPKDWPKDAKGKRITDFSVKVLIQKEHILQFD
jgi:hypothetical protein